MKRVKCNNTELSFDAKSLAFSVTREGETWNWDTNYCPKIQTKQGTIHFQDAETITHSDWKTGLGEGVLSHYEGFTVDGVKTNLAFDTIAWIESVSGDVFSSSYRSVNPVLISKKYSGREIWNLTALTTAGTHC